jgi:hypothetical protein
MEYTQQRVELYILAGVATSVNFMDDFRQEMVRRYKLADYEVFSSMLFPYGDWSRSLVKQVLEISYDLFPVFRDKRTYFRGQMIANHIKNNYKGGKIVIIGHSSGGVAGVHAANKLYKGLFPDVHVVQIGSPKCAVPFDQRATTCFIRAVNGSGKTVDPITRLGTWGGWSKIGGMVNWNSRLKAPAAIFTVPIIGGHADYFRDRAPFLDEKSKSNLDKTTDLLWNWLMQ